MQKLFSCFWSYKSLKSYQATRKPKWKVKLQIAKCITEGAQDYKMQTVVDGEATEYKLCKLCGCMLNTDYI